MLHPGIVGLRVPVLFKIESEEAQHGASLRRTVPIYAAYAVLQSHAIRIFTIANPEWPSTSWYSAYPGALFFFEPSCIELDFGRGVLSYPSFTELGFTGRELESWNGLEP
jgi:hypothetical protein